MKYRILDKTPLSGTAPEFFYGEHQGPATWIEFNDESECWYGVFENGKLFSPKIKIEFVKDYMNILVEGNFFRINTQTKQCEFKITESDILEFQEDIQEQIYIFVLQTEILIYKKHVQTKRIEIGFSGDAKISSFSSNIIEIALDHGEGLKSMKYKI